LKRKITLFVAIVIILIAIINIKPIMKHTSNVFWNFVGNQLEKEEEERMKKIEDGEIVRGKDTILIWGNMYEIGHFSDGDRLTIETSDTDGTILEKVLMHKKKNSKLYVISGEGYAVIDHNNLCRVFIAIDDERYTNGYTEDEDGKRVYISRKIECSNIKYLSKYEDFSEEEQKVFRKMKD